MGTELCVTIAACCTAAHDPCSGHVQLPNFSLRSSAHHAYVTVMCTAAGCVQKNFSRAAGGICVPEGFGAGAIDDNLVRDNNSCRRNTAAGTPYTPACQISVDEFSLRTGCAELCIQEKNQDRVAVCQAQSSTRCPTATAPPCAQYTGDADATGVPSLTSCMTLGHDCLFASSPQSAAVSGRGGGLPLLCARCQYDSFCDSSAPVQVSAITSHRPISAER